MSPVQRVVICGTSLYLMSIEVSLDKLPEMQVVRLDTRLPNSEERILALAPDVIIVERDSDDAHRVRPLSSRGLPLVELDMRQNKIMVQSERLLLVCELDDLAQIIQQVAAGDPAQEYNCETD